MNSKTVQIMGLILAMVFFLAPFIRLWSSIPIAVVVTALFWPHVPGAVKEILAIASISQGYYHAYIIGLSYHGFGSDFWPLHKSLYAPYIFTGIYFVYFVYFKLLRSLFDKVGLDSRIRAINKFI